MGVETKLNTDSEGFISQECPACSGRFKVKYAAGAPRPVSYCPYCCHRNRAAWWTKPQASYIESAAGVSDHELERMLLDVLKGSNEVNIKKLPGGCQPDAPSEPQEAWPVVEFASKELIKHDGSKSTLYCPVTGEEVKLAGGVPLRVG